MNKLFSLKAALVAASILVLPLAQAATMTRADYNAGKTRISPDYKADNAACGGQAGNAKDVCVKQAKAIEIKALADAKMGKEIGAAKTDAAEDKRDADYNVAIQKCDGLSGDAKANCVTAAKTRFGKN